MAGRVLVRKKNLLPKNSGPKPILDKVSGKDLWRKETCGPCCYPSWSCHIKARVQQRPKQFAVSQRLAEASKPILYESDIKEQKLYDREVYTASGYQAFYKYLHTRIWLELVYNETSGKMEPNTDGVTILDSDLKEYDWRWTGQFNTYIGKHKSIISRLAKRGKKSDQQKTEISKPDSEACPF